MNSLKNKSFCNKFLTFSVLTIVAIAILWQLSAFFVEVIESHDSLLIEKSTNLTVKESDEHKRDRFYRYESSYRHYVAKVVLYSILQVISYIVLMVSVYKDESMVSILVATLLLLGTVLAKLSFSGRPVDIVVNGLILLVVLISHCCDRKTPSSKSGSTCKRKEKMQMQNIVVG